MNLSISSFADINKTETEMFVNELRINNLEVSFTQYRFHRIIEYQVNRDLKDHVVQPFLAKV